MWNDLGNLGARLYDKLDKRWNSTMAVGTVKVLSQDARLAKHLISIFKR